MDLLDHDDDSPGPLAAPRLVDDGGFKCQTRQPGAVFARLLVPQMVSANEMLRRFVRVAPIAELQVGREGSKEFARRDTHSFGAAQIAEVDFAERVALLVADAARRVVAEEHLGRIVDAVDLIHQDEEPFALGKHDQLRPPRPGFTAWGGILELVGRLHRDEILAADYLRLDGLHPVTKLRAFHHSLSVTAAVGHEGIGSAGWIGLVGVPRVTADAMPIGSDYLVAP